MSFPLLWIFAAPLSLSVECSQCCCAETTNTLASDLEMLLGRPVLAEGQLLAEMRRFCERRIAVFPDDVSWTSWQREAERLRLNVLDDVVFRGVPSAWREASRRIEWLDRVPGGPGYRIKKLRYEALPGLWIPALLYEPERLQGRVPAVLNVNGHEKTGKAAPYKQLRCINLAKRGMLALNVEWLGMGQLQGDGFSHNCMNQLDLCGTSGLAVFYLAMERALDLLVDHPHADGKRIAMAGLSGGGWQTILLSSLDRRVTLSNPVAGYSSFRTRVEFFSDVGDAEQAPNDLAMLADYTHLTAMRAPRPTLLTYNAKDDCCFAAAHALPPLLDAASPIFELADAGERLRSHVNKDPGDHNFDRENREAFYRIVGDHFFAGDDSYTRCEIESQREVKSAEDLNVPMPEHNSNFNKLAVALMADLPRHKSPLKKPGNPPGASDKPTSRSVGSIARLLHYIPTAKKVGKFTAGATNATFWRITLGGDWTVPVVELCRGTPRGTSCVAADDGRMSAVELIESLLRAKRRVLAVDLFCMGESKIEKHHQRFALFVTSVGARPLGVQADQLQAVTRWATIEFREPVRQHVAIGPRSTLAALVAAATATDNERPQQLVLHSSLRSMREVIQNNWSVDEYPELFCFGLLQHCDIEDLVELAKPCAVARK